jgi:hypothetical protein
VIEETTPGTQFRCTDCTETFTVLQPAGIERAETWRAEHRCVEPLRLDEFPWWWRLAWRLASRRRRTQMVRRAYAQRDSVDE